MDPRTDGGRTEQRIDAGRTEIVTSSGLTAEATEVWRRSVSPEGINFELGPWLKMTVPAALRDVGIDDVELGSRLGRSWILALGVIPFEYDDLVLIERGPGLRFLESSRMASMKSWQHERVVRPEAGGCELRDTVRFELRSPLGIVPGVTGIAIRLVARIFQHRHRRAKDFFGGDPPL